MANRYKDPDELNNRYKPEDDDEEYIPEEELTEEERERWQGQSEVSLLKVGRQYLDG